jgi:hypothetical protein
MSPLSPAVLGTSALLASPALYRGFVVDTMPLGVVLQRYAATLAICWVAISIVAEVVFSRTAHGKADESAVHTPEIRPEDDHPLAG